MKTPHAILLALGLSAPLLFAQAPDRISYQGRVVDSTGTGIGTGTPVNRKIIFRLFDAPTGGTRVWSEEQTVTLAGGEFSVMLGQGVNASSNGSPENPRPPLKEAFGGSGDRYLEIVVDNGDGTLNNSDTPITPRQRLTSTAYALRAATADAVTLNSDLSLRDPNHGLGWYGSSRLFGGANIDGPVLYGWSGGALGSNQNGTLNTALRWNGSGHVGIGGIAASSNYKLDIAGDAHGSGNLFIDGNFGLATTDPMAKIGIRAGGTNVGGGGSPALAFEYSTGGYRHFVRSRHNATGSALGNALDFYLNTSVSDGGSTAPGTGNAAALTIDAQGVGIGTTTPAAKLDLRGTALINDGALAAPTLSVLGGGGSRLVLWPGVDGINTPYGFGMDSGTMWSTVPQGSAHRWYTGTTERMALNSNGDMTLGRNLTLGGTVHATGSVISDGTAYTTGGIKMNGGFEPETSFGGGTGNFISFGSPGFSEDYLGYAQNTFYLRDSVGGGDSTPPNLAVQGNITANGRSVPEAEEQLRIVRGNVNNAGAILAGSGFTVTKQSDGNFTVTITTEFSNTPTVTISPLDPGDREAAQVGTITNNSFKARVRNASNGDSTNYGFTFIAVGPR